MEGKGGGPIRGQKLEKGKSQKGLQEDPEESPISCIGLLQSFSFCQPQTLSKQRILKILGKGTKALLPTGIWMHKLFWKLHLKSTCTKGMGPGTFPMMELTGQVSLELSTHLLPAVQALLEAVSEKKQGQALVWGAPLPLDPASRNICLDAEHG